MATYQEQIAANAERKVNRDRQLMVDLAILSKVHEAVAFLQNEQLLTMQEGLIILKKYIDLHPEIKKLKTFPKDPE